MQAAIRLWQFDEIAWEESPSARGSGAVRKPLAQGESGLHVVHVKHPPGFLVKPHAHDTDEMLYVLDGGCQVTGGPELRPNDAVTVPAGLAYGFRAGEHGMRFLTIRTAATSFRFSDGSRSQGEARQKHGGE